MLISFHLLCDLLNDVITYNLEMSLSILLNATVQISIRPTRVTTTIIDSLL